MSAEDLCASHERQLVTGHNLDRVTEIVPHCDPFQNLVGTTALAILDRQRANSDPTRPLSFDLDEIWKKIRNRFQVIARGLYQKELAEERRISIKFDGWLPATPPTQAWEQQWTRPGFLKWCGAKLRALFPRNACDVPGKHAAPTDRRGTVELDIVLALRAARGRLARVDAI